MLVLDEFADPNSFDSFQIVLDTHVIVFPVSVVHTIYLPARILVAINTEGGIAFRRMIDARAFAEQIPAPLVSWTAADALASFQIVHI